MKGNSNKSAQKTVSLLDKVQKQKDAAEAQERIRLNLKKAKEDEGEGNEDASSVASGRSLRSNRSLTPVVEVGSTSKKRAAGAAKKGRASKRLIKESFIAGMDLSIIDEDPDESVAVSDEEFAIACRRIGGKVGHVFALEGESIEKIQKERHQSIGPPTGPIVGPTQLNTPAPAADDSDSEEGTFEGESSSSGGSDEEREEDDDPFRFTMQSVDESMFVGDASFDSIQSQIHLTLSAASSGPSEAVSTPKADPQTELEKAWGYKQELDWTVHEDREPLPDEMEGMYRTLVENGGTSQKESYAKNVFTMLSCIVMDAICTSGKEMKATAQYYACEKNFTQLRETFPKTEYGKRMLFHFFEGGKWPACFTEYCDKLYADVKGVGKKWANNYAPAKGLQATLQIQIYVGSKIKDAWSDAKRDIQKYLAKKWKPPHTLASGWTEEGFFRMLRRSLFKGICWERAKASQSTKKFRAKPGKGNNAETESLSEEAPVAEKVTNEAATVLTREMRAQKGLEKMLTTHDWYPNYWMAFVMYGQPSKEKMLLSLNGGSPEIATIDPTQDPACSSTSTGGSSRARSPNAQLATAGRQSKTGRQAIRDGDKLAAAAQRSSDVSTVTATIQESVQIKHIHVHEVKGSAMQDLRTQIELQRELVDRLKESAGDDEELLKEVKEENAALLQMYRLVKSLR